MTWNLSTVDWSTVVLIFTTIYFFKINIGKQYYQHNFYFRKSEYRLLNVARQTLTKGRGYVMPTCYGLRDKYVLHGTVSRGSIQPDSCRLPLTVSLICTNTIR